MREAQALLAQRRKIEAIKLLSERFGIPLAAAKTAVEALEKLGLIPSPDPRVRERNSEMQCRALLQFSC